MTRLMPKTLAGQLIALLLIALVLSQAVSFLVFVKERRTAISLVSREHALARTAGIVRLLVDTPVELHQRIVETASSKTLRFWLADSASVPPDGADAADQRSAAELRSLLAEQARQVRVKHGEERWFRPRRRFRDGRRRRDGGGRFRPRHGHVAWLGISVETGSGRWLNVATQPPRFRPVWAWPAILSMVLMAIATTAIVILVIRRLTRPLRRLSDAAERLGRGETVAAIPKTGPLEIRQTTEAFNQMSERLSRFVQDRTRMLAAISHDLRTPITSLRLRAELIEDAEARDKILETLDDMQRMAEATLAFAREEAAREDTRVVDLAALVDAVCADIAEIGEDVSFSGPDKLPCRCRSVAVKRALRNLIENAVAYGTRARIVLSRGAEEATVVVDDDGPGIPDGELEEVFQPFFRLEGSRARETGGVGLGLAIARSIIRGHGGDIVLQNREDGGLRATVTLPLSMAL